MVSIDNLVALSGFYLRKEEIILIGKFDPMLRRYANHASVKSQPHYLPQQSGFTFTSRPTGKASRIYTADAPISRR